MEARMKLDDVYRKAVAHVVQGKKREELEAELTAYKPELDCLFNPKAYPVVWSFGDCICDDKEREACIARCDFQAIVPVGEHGIEVDADKCVACTTCVDACGMEKLQASKDVIPALELLRNKGGRYVYALVAPAFQGQFSADVTAGKLRTAFTALGFDGMIEVALFADILTLKEAFEFNQNVTKEGQFQLTSCCCPIWIGMIRRIYHELVPHLPGAVSPMIAAGRTIKKFDPDALTVFIGPCLAKKAEAREKDLAGAIDFVLTFQEVQDIFDAMQIDPATLPESSKDHSSRAGRIYARIDGVCEAVRETLRMVDPDRHVEIRTEHADGVKDCKDMLARVQNGDIHANFYEGMGCKGGCVGGPKAIIPAAEGTKNVNAYGREAQYESPITNPYVLDVLHRLGFETVRGFLENSTIYTRNF